MSGGSVSQPYAALHGQVQASLLAMGSPRDGRNTVKNQLTVLDGSAPAIGVTRLRFVFICLVGTQAAAPRPSLAPLDGMCQ
jgi:hypothetical protein